MSDITLDYAVPADDLSEYISLFYLFRADVATFEDRERADRAQFRLRLTGGGASYRFHDGTEQVPHDWHIIGPTSGSTRVRSAGPVRLFGMGLTPAGWGAIVGGEASSVLNRVIDAHQVIARARLRSFAEALGGAADIGACVAIAEPLVRQLLRDDGAAACGFVRQVDGWLSAAPSPDIDRLIALTGLSRRQVERKCNALYGAPPKLLARKYRALRAAVALVADGARIDDVIARGFYDQSHLIREVKQFTGLTPRQLRAQPSVLERMTMAQRGALGDRVSPLISET